MTGKEQVGPIKKSDKEQNNFLGPVYLLSSL